MMHRFLARLPKQPARLRRRLRHRRGSGIVLGSSALFANSHAQSTTSKEVIRADVREMARVFNLCVSSACRHATRPWMRPCRARPSAMCSEQRQVPDNRRPQPQARGLPIGSCAILLVSCNSACCAGEGHAHRSQTYSRGSRRLLCGTALFCAAGLCPGARHDPRERLCLLLCRARRP